MSLLYINNCVDFWPTHSKYISGYIYLTEHDERSKGHESILNREEQAPHAEMHLPQLSVILRFLCYLWSTSHYITNNSTYFFMHKMISVG